MRYELAVMDVDGCAKGNPGLAGAGVVMRDAGGEVVFKLSEPLGERTSNQAEYMSLILGLERVISDYDVKTLIVRSDSELLVKQVTGTYKVKKPELIALKAQVDTLVGQLGDFRIEHIRREENEEADRLSTAAVKPPDGERSAGKYVSIKDIERYCIEGCEVGQFDDARCLNGGCHLYMFTCEVLDP